MSTIEPQRVDVDDLIQQGLTLLREDMERYDSFDPTRDYDEKNAYFLRAQELGDPLLGWRQYDIAERFFGTMLRSIPDYERASGKHFNKGIVYAYVGIVQIASGKLDTGIAHLLTADWEDRDFIPKVGHGILNTHLWQQFERPMIFDYLIGFSSNPDAALGFIIDEDFLVDLFQGMEKQDRIFLEGTIWALRENLRQDEVCSNVYTWGQLYSGLKDLCLLTETLLRKRQIQDGVISARDRIMLGDDRRRRRPGLLTNALTGQSIGYPQSDLSTSANDLQEFVDNLENILTNANNAELRRVYCLHLVRNFTGHHFDLSDRVTSPGSRTFFDMYEVVLVNVLSAILYFEFINAI